jgi:thymidine phosphorylase
MQPDANVTTIGAAAAGFISGIDVVRLGNTARELSSANPFAGIRVLVRIGDEVTAGTPLAEIYGDAASVQNLETAFEQTPGPPPTRPLIYETVPPPLSS